MHHHPIQPLDPPRAARAATVVRAVLAAVLVALALTASACDGSSLRSDPTDNQTRILGTRVWVVVTRSGGKRLVARRSVRVTRGDTALSVLQQVADVRMAPNGAVAQVNGMGGGALSTFGPEPLAWTYRVDGIESNIDPDRFRIKPGMSVWWDLRRIDIYEHLPVSVGVFPEPLFTGWRDTGRKLRIAYGAAFEKDADYFRDSVFGALNPETVSLGGEGAGIGGNEGGRENTGDAETTVAVRKRNANLVIARWEEARRDPYIADMGLDPRPFGLTIFIAGTDIIRQDPDEEGTSVLGDAEGVVWASTIDGEPDGPIVFLITGLTDEGVKAAARALKSGSCQFYIACAVTREGEVVRSTSVPQR